MYLFFKTCSKLTPPNFPVFIKMMAIKSRSADLSNFASEMLVLHLVAILLVLKVHVHLCLQKHCIYYENNTCSSCDASQDVRNITTFPESNGLTVYFCSKMIPLQNELIVENQREIVFIGEFGVAVYVVIECNTSTRAGFVFRNVTDIEINSLTLIGCGIGRDYFLAEVSDMLKMSSSVLITNSCNIVLNGVIIKQHKGIGLAMLNVGGEVNINRSIFGSNRLHKEHQDWGSGLYIEITQCVCPNRNTEGSVYKINQCTFEMNKASSCPSVNTLDENSFFNSMNKDSQSLGRGGGISITISGNATNNSITILHSRVESNSGLWGGGVYALFKDLATFNELLMRDVNFTNNTSPQTGGGGGLAISFISLDDGKRGYNNTIQLNKCHFDSNNAGFGGGVTFYASESSDFATLNNVIKFRECTWANNTALIGAAVDLSSHIWSENKGYLPEVEFSSCSFLSNTIVHKIRNDHSNSTYTYHTKGKGALYSVSYNLIFSGKTEFYNNTGSALYLVSSVANFSPKSEVEFCSNKGFSGGAVTMIGFSGMNFGDNTSFTFLNNSAEDRGGAIVSVSINKKDLIDTQVCFLDYLGNQKDVRNRHVRFLFEDNSAGAFGRNMEVEGHYGHSIFVTSLSSCRKHCTQSNIENEDVLGCIANFTFVDRLKYDISTSGKEIKLSENAVIPMEIIPGKLVDLPINMTDELSHEVGDLFHVLVTKLGTSQVEIDYLDAYISEKFIRFFGTPGDKAKITIETINLREIGMTFEIEIQQCPPGFVQIAREVAQRQFHTCICSASTKSKRYSGIHRCNDTEFVALLNRGFWMGYDQDGENGTEEYLRASYCPRGFCTTNDFINDHESEIEYKLPQNTSISALRKSMCGNFRTGIVCGKCEGNYTTYYHSTSYKCKDARKCHLGWLFYILSEIVPVTLTFVLIMVFDIKLTTGAFNAFLYFAQVSETMLITANGFVVFPYNTFLFIKINHFVYRMFNLNFFATSSMSFCLWKSAQTLDLLIFKYVTIIYALLLVFVIIAFMRFCNCSSKNRVISKIQQKKRGARSTIIHGLTGFLVMCYSECTRISLLLLTPVWLQGPSGSGVNYLRRVVFYNGELSFFKGVHLLYAIPALFFLIFLGILPPLLLISYPLCYKVFAFLNISETRFISVLCKCIPLESLRPLFDSFQSSFRDNCRFFAGLYFSYRLIILCSFAFLHSLSEFYLMVQAQFVVILAIHTFVQPYKKHWHNVVDGLIFLLLNIINAMTLFNFKHTRDLLDFRRVIHTVCKIQTVLLYIPLLYIVIYITIVTYKKVNFKKMCKRKRKQNIEPKSNAVLSLVVDTQDSMSDELLDSAYHHRKSDDDQDF